MRRYLLAALFVGLSSDYNLKRRVLLATRWLSYLSGSIKMRARCDKCLVCRLTTICLKYTASMLPARPT